MYLITCNQYNIQAFTASCRNELQSCCCKNSFCLFWMRILILFRVLQCFYEKQWTWVSHLHGTFDFIDSALATWWPVTKETGSQAQSIKCVWLFLCHFYLFVFFCFFFFAFVHPLERWETRSPHRIQPEDTTFLWQEPVDILWSLLLIVLISELLLFLMPPNTKMAEGLWTCLLSLWELFPDRLSLGDRQPLSLNSQGWFSLVFTSFNCSMLRPCCLS